MCTAETLQACGYERLSEFVVCGRSSLTEDQISSLSPVVAACYGGVIIAGVQHTGTTAYWYKFKWHTPGYTFFFTGNNSKAAVVIFYTTTVNEHYLYVEYLKSLPYLSAILVSAMTNS